MPIQSLLLDSVSFYTFIWLFFGVGSAFKLASKSPEYHPLVARAKDVAAAAVLLSAAGSTIIGILIFLPKLIRIFG